MLFHPIFDDVDFDIFTLLTLMILKLLITLFFFGLLIVFVGLDVGVDVLQRESILYKNVFSLKLANLLLV